jgi:hypothetical protein
MLETRHLAMLVVSGILLSLTPGQDTLLHWAVAILVSFLTPRLACALYVLVAIIWFIPDRRIERALAEAGR